MCTYLHQVEVEVLKEYYIVINLFESKRTYKVVIVTLDYCLEAFKDAAKFIRQVILDVGAVTYQHKL